MAKASEKVVGEVCLYGGPGFGYGYLARSEVGDIFHYSWGYDQTNCEFFQVVATTKGTVTLHEIEARHIEGSEGFMSDRRTAVKDAFLERTKPIVKVVQYDRSGKPYISMDYGCCDPWDGKPQYCSWYA